MSNPRLSVLACALFAFVAPAAAQQDRHGEDRHGQDLTMEDLEGANCSEVNYSGCDLSNTILIGTNLHGANLSRANLQDADLTGANLTDAKLEGATLTGCTFDKANLQGVDFTGAYVTKAKFRFADLRLSKGMRDISGADFSGADVRGAHLAEVVSYGSEKVSFRGAQYDRRTRFPSDFVPEIEEVLLVQEEGPIQRTDISRQNLSGKDLRTMDLEGANASEANLSKCNLSKMNLRGANLRGADLSGADLTGADLTGADLRDAKLDGVLLKEANLSKANLEGVDFKGVAFDSTLFAEANLRNARGLRDISRSDFGGADVRGTYLADAFDYATPKANFRGAKADRRTHWHKGFDPKAAGVVVDNGDSPVVKKDKRRSKWSGRDLRMEDLEGADLTDSDLSGCNLQNAILRGANLTGVDLSRADLTGADLTGAILTDARFDSAILSETNFTDANLAGVDFARTAMNAVVFRGANLRKTRGYNWITTGDFARADLCGAYLIDATFCGTRPDFQGAKYDRRTRWPKDLDPTTTGAVKVEDSAEPPKEATPPPKEEVKPPVDDGNRPEEEVIPPGLDLHDQDLRDRKFGTEELIGANLERANCRAVKYTEMELKGVRAKGVDFVRADLSGTDFWKADLREAKFEGATLEGTDFKSASLAGADFGDAYLTDASLNGADLRGLKRIGRIKGTDFRGADLRGANLIGPSFEDFASCRWRGAKYDKTTQWPKGLDLEAMRVEFVGEPGEAGDSKDPSTDVPRLDILEKPPDAPSEANIKQVLQETWVRELYRKPMTTSDPRDSIVHGEAQNWTLTCDFKIKAYLPPETAEIQGEKTKLYPVQVKCDVIAQTDDGTQMMFDVDGVFRFFKGPDGKWNRPMGAASDNPARAGEVRPRFDKPLWEYKRQVK